jgi:CheY-like chemotaxis protein
MARILVIDDHHFVRDVVGKLLESAGHEVTEAPDGEEGLRAVRSRPADLVLCELYLPMKDELETIRDLRHEFPGVKIIAMTGGGFHYPDEALAIAEEMGADATLKKPFVTGQFLKVVEETLGTGA